MERIDSFAVPESLDRRTRSATATCRSTSSRPTRNATSAYSAYYAAGLRACSSSTSGLTEVGRFIDEGGNNFWGIEQFTTSQGKRLIAASDRDHGLYLFEYTGPRKGYVAPAQPPRACRPRRRT